MCHDCPLLCLPHVLQNVKAYVVNGDALEKSTPWFALRSLLLQLVTEYCNKNRVQESSTGKGVSLDLQKSGCIPKSNTHGVEQGGVRSRTLSKLAVGLAPMPPSPHSVLRQRLEQQHGEASDQVPPRLSRWESSSSSTSAGDVIGEEDLSPSIGGPGLAPMPDKLMVKLVMPTLRDGKRQQLPAVTPPARRPPVVASATGDAAPPAGTTPAVPTVPVLAADAAGATDATDPAAGSEEPKSTDLSDDSDSSNSSSDSDSDSNNEGGKKEGAKGNTEMYPLCSASNFVCYEVFCSN